MEVIKRGLACAAVIAAVTFSSGAHALTTTYDLTLNPLPHLGATGGTATLVLDGTFGHDVLSLDILFDLPNGKTLSFDFSGASLHNAIADVVGGKVTNLDAFDIILSKGSVLFSNQGLIFLDFKNPRFDSVDSFFSTKEGTSAPSDPPPSATPAPATWTMMLLGLSLLGWLAWRRRPIASVA
jgi:hypothetical protein